MLLDDFIRVRVSNRTKKYFLEKGYVEDSGFFNVLPEDMNETNRTKVRCECDYCGLVNTITWSNYVLQINRIDVKIYSCHKCHYNKSKMVFMEKYGVDCVLKSEEIKNKIRDTNLKKYGVDCVFKSEEIKDKIRDTNLERYGVDSILKSKEIRDKSKNTNLERYGVDNPFYSDSKFRKDINDKLKISLNKDFVKEKRKETCFEKYGFSNPMQVDNIKKKCKNTNFEKYGTRHPMQSGLVFDRMMKSAFKYKTHKGSNIDYQGTYELDFLERYYEKLNISKIEPIRYKHNDKYHYYHPDFYIPEYNLIVEIKSTYTYNYDLERNQAKYDYSIRAGYNFIFIIDKDYTDFEELL
jgi:hypothetical protein